MIYKSDSTRPTHACVQQAHNPLMFANRQNSSSLGSKANIIGANGNVTVSSAIEKDPPRSDQTTN